MRSDSDIKRDVEDELRWDPDIDATDIAVSVNNGVVTLAGFVRSFMQKYQAEADAKRVAGVLAVANDLEIRLPGVDERPDPDIARDAIARIKSELPYAWDKIRVIREKRLGYARRRSRVELPAGTCRGGGPPGSWCEGHHQLHRGEASGRALGNQAQDRGCVAACR